MERVQAIFEYVSELDPSEREKFLQQICNEDPQLLADLRLRLEQAQADTVDLPRHEATPPVEPPKFIFSPGDLIGSRYVVIRTIAKGGMGEVYEVNDFELRSRVALKTISLKSAARPNAFDMFRREILLARQVTHPNVCRIYDLGHHNHPEHGDMLFLTMELLNGETLAHRIRKNGPMNKAEALPLLRQMIDALAAAHQLNIAHRDFKSGNVILCEPVEGSGTGPRILTTPSSGPDSKTVPVAPDSGRKSGPVEVSPSGKVITDRTGGPPSTKSTVVKVTDFGLARSVDGLETTVHGEVWGTPDYMAPEQFHGVSSIASDIYSLGVVIYEMFTGKLPHRSNSGGKTPDGRPSSEVAKIPVEWQPVIKQCMAYEPADRYRSVDDVWLALNGALKDDGRGGKKFLGLRYRTFATVTASLVLLVGILAGPARGSLRRWITGLPDQKHIAVLQFQNIGDDPSNAAFSAGVGETLTSKLSQLGTDQPEYWVVPFSDSRKYTDVEEARRNLDVTLVVTGSVQRTKEGARLTINLIDANKHKVLASRVMTASMGELNLLQDMAWESVVQMVRLRADAQTTNKLRESETGNPRAYDYYEQGVGYLQMRDLASIDNAIAMFLKSSEEDPNFALAHAGLGSAYATKYAVTKDPAWISEASKHAELAVSLAPDLSPVHEARGRVYENTGKLDDALAEYRQAVKLNPMAVTSSLRIANIYALQGKTDESEKAYKAAIQARPSYWSGYTGLGGLYFNVGRFSDAAAQFEKMVELAPDQPLGYENLGAAYSQMGQYSKAIETFNKGLAIKASPELWSDLGGVYMFTGDNIKAAEAMKKAVDLNPHNHVLWRNLADSYRQNPSLADKAAPTYSKALEVAQQQLTANPTDREALSGVALYQAHLGSKAEARKSIAKALQAAPNDADTLFTAALAYELIGDRKLALSSLQSCLQAGFSVEDVKREPELKALQSDPGYARMMQKTQPSSN